MKSHQRYLAAEIFFLCAVSTAAFTTENAQGLQNFLETYRCAVVERLELTHARGDRTGKDEFLILAPRSAGERYVQCIFHDRDTAIFCEAASGFYAPPQLRFHLDASALRRLGFSTDGSKGNYAWDISGITRADFPRIADMILATLYDVCGVRLGSELEWKTPFAPEIKGVHSACVPIG